MATTEPGAPARHREHFACTACGRCCAEGPEMTITEAIELGDVFVPSLLYRLTRIPKSENEAAWSSLVLAPDFASMDKREYAERVRQSVTVAAGIELAGDHGYDAYVTVTSRPWYYPSPYC